MKKLVSSVITLISAVAISAVAAFISVSGMMALFEATAVTVCVMMIVLEASKLVAAGWLHANWKNRNVNFLHKFYLTTAVLVLMAVTAIGIYGFLSKGHLEQSAPLANVELQIQQREQQIKTLQNANERLTTRLTQLDSSIDSMIGKGNAAAGLKARRTQAGERSSIEKEMNANNTKIQTLNDEILPLKSKTNEVEAKLGPVKYVAELFGWSDTNSAVRLVILMLMFAFDPLAVVLLISSTITFEEYVELRRARKEQAIQEAKQQLEDKPIPATVPPEVASENNQPVEDLTVIPNAWAGVPVTLVPVQPQETPEVELALEPVEEKKPDTYDPHTVIREYLGEEQPDVAGGMQTLIDNLQYKGIQDVTKEPPSAPKVNLETQAAPIHLEVIPTVEPKLELTDTPEHKIAQASELEVVTTDELTPVDEKQLVIDLLEKRPEILEELIDIVNTYRKNDESKVQVPPSEILPGATQEPISTIPSTGSRWLDN